MSAGTLIRIAECIVTIYCGVRLAVSSCKMRSEAVYLYIDAKYEQPWHWLQIVSMFITMAVVVDLLYLKQGDALIRCRFKTSYLLFIGIAIAEILTEQYLFTEENLNLVKVSFLFICILVFWAVVSLVLLFFAYRNYQESSHHERMADMNLHILEKQYTLLQKMYTEKRRQVHDAVHHDVLLIGYLRDGQTEEALGYLEKKLDESQNNRKNSYTGIAVIDLMLDYKMNEAKKEISEYVWMLTYISVLLRTQRCVLCWEIFLIMRLRRPFLCLCPSGRCRFLCEHRIIFFCYR